MQKYTQTYTDDHLGNIKQMRSIGNWTRNYYYGTTSYRSGRNTAETSLKRYHYVAKELDNETGLYYYGMRYYSAVLARFVSVDPLAAE